METPRKMTRREFLEWLCNGSILFILFKILAILGIPSSLLLGCTPDEGQKTSTDSLLTLTEYRTATSAEKFLNAVIKNLRLIFEMIRGNESPLLGETTEQNIVTLVNNVGLLGEAVEATTNSFSYLHQGVDPQKGVDPQRALELTTVSLSANDRLAQEASSSSHPVLRLVAALNLFNAYSSYRRVGGERDEETEEKICGLATIDQTTKARGSFLNRVVGFEENLSIDFWLRIFCDPFILIELKENAEELRRKIGADCWDRLFTSEYFIEDLERLIKTLENQGITDFLRGFFGVIGGIDFHQEFTACVDEGLGESSFLDLLQKTLYDSRSAFSQETIANIDSKRGKVIEASARIWGVGEDEVDEAILSPEEIIKLSRDANLVQRVCDKNSFKETLRVGLRQALRIIRDQGGEGANFLGTVSIDGFSLVMKQIVEYLNQAISNNNITQETLNKAARMMRIKGGRERLAQYIKEFSHDDFGDRDFQEKLFEALIRELVDEVVERAFLGAKRMFPPFFIQSFRGDRLKSESLPSSFFQPLFSQQILIFDPEVSLSFNPKRSYLPDLRIIKDPRILKKILFGTTSDGQPLVNGGILVNLSIGGSSPFGILIPTNFFANFSQQIGSVQQEQKNSGASDSQLTNYNLVTDVEVGGCHLHIPLQSEVTLGGEGIPLQFIGIIYMAMEKEEGSLDEVQPCLILKDKLGGVYISKGPEVNDVLKIESLEIGENVSEVGYRPCFVTNDGRRGYFLNLPEGIYNPGLMPVHYQAYTEIKRILKGDEGDMLWRLLLSPGVTQEIWGYFLPRRYYLWDPTSAVIPKSPPAPFLFLIREIGKGERRMYPIGFGPHFPLPLIIEKPELLVSLPDGERKVYVVGAPSIPDSGDSLTNALKKIFGYGAAFVVVLPNQVVPVEDKMRVEEFLFRNKAALFFLISLVVEMGFRATAVGEILLRAGVGTGILDLLLLKILIEAKGLH